MHGHRLPLSLFVLASLLAGCTPDETTPRPYVPPGDRRVSGDPGAGDAAGDPGPGDAPSPFWHCKPTYYGTDDGCDCGCGIPDPDCNGQGCFEPSCDDTGCEFCHNATGVPFTCGTTPPPDVPAEWSCEQFFYADQYCDCGCSIQDIDCAGLGCTNPGCEVPACDFCWDDPDFVACGGSDGGPPGGD